MKSNPVPLLIGLFLCTFMALAQESAAPSASPAAAPAATEVSPAEAPPTESPPGELVPEIKFTETPLTTVIEALARQARINYILDPKVNFGQPGPDGQPIPTPIITLRWENVTADQALSALLNNYNMVLVEDPKTKIYRITFRDPDAPPPLVTRIIQLKYANPSNMVAAIQTTFTDKRSKAIPDTRTSQLVVVATEPELMAVDELVQRLDTPTRQVLIEAHLVETSRNPSSAKGVDWTQTLGVDETSGKPNQQFSFGNGLSTATTETTIPGPPTTVTLPGDREITVTPRSSSKTVIKNLAGLGVGGLSLNTFQGWTPNIAFLNAAGLNAALAFLNKDSDARVLATPRAVTLDNETAHLSVTRATPIFRNTAGTQGSPGGSEVQYTNLGTILMVTPRISANDYIWLRVVPEVSSVFRTITKTVASTVNQADEYDIRKIDTQVLIPSGNTLVMGGLMSDNSNQTYSKVPVLGDIPGLGWAFRYEGKNAIKRNLLIFVTPTIIKDADFHPTETEFLRNKIPDPGVEVPPSFWDSGKPLDWSKPVRTPRPAAAAR